MKLSVLTHGLLLFLCFGYGLALGGGSAALMFQHNLTTVWAIFPTPPAALTAFLYEMLDDVSFYYILYGLLFLGLVVVTGVWGVLAFGKDILAARRKTQLGGPNSEP